MRPILGILLLLLGTTGMVAELLSLKLPSASWYFDTSRRIPFFNVEGFPWYGWTLAILSVLAGIFMIVKSCMQGKAHPAVLRRKERFYEVRRGVWSLRIILLLVFLAGLDFLIVGNKPLIVKYEGELLFPAFERKIYKGEEFGVKGDLANAPVNFRSLRHVFTPDSGNWMIMPLIPYAPTGDSLPPICEELTLEDGRYKTASGELYSGLAARVFAPELGGEEVSLHVRYRLRDGQFSGPADGWDEAGERIYSARYQEGEKLEEKYYGQGTTNLFLNKTPSVVQVIHYHPAPPSKDHILGTDSNGNDVLAYLYGGLQVNIQAALFYIPFVYAIGVTIGLLMGYFGGWFDLILQRIIEALEAIPFLFVIIIISSVIPIEYKGLGMILLILVCFGWMGKTYLMRSAAYKEKARDYVASARVIGAGTPRILVKHILPNILSILVTIIPFAISGVITAITSLDYLGFGLPPRYASWGKLLNDGLSNLSSPWLVSSAFFALVVILTLITFVGEAVREAWDPRKFTTYR